MRTWGLLLLSTKRTLLHAPQAFMWLRMRARRSAGGLSMNPTVSLTPLEPQYFLVTTLRRAGGGSTKSGARARMAWIGGALRGLIRTALSAAAARSAVGTVLMVHEWECAVMGGLLLDCLR